MFGYLIPFESFEIIIQLFSTTTLKFLMNENYNK